MHKFNIRREGGLIAGELHGEFTGARTIEFRNPISVKDLSGLILPQDHIQWASSDGKKHSAVILKVVPLFPDNMPMVGKGAKITLDHEIPGPARR